MLPVSGRRVERVDPDPEPSRVSADLVQRRKPEVPVERGVLDALRHHGTGRLLEADDEVVVSALAEQEDVPQTSGQSGALDLFPVRVRDCAVRRPDVRPVHVERRKRSGEIRLVTAPTPGAKPYGIKIDAQGTPYVACNGSNCLLKVDPATLATSAPGIFAGGDVAFGPRNLIEAVANGKRAARSIHEFFSAGGAAVTSGLAIDAIPTRDYRMIAGFERLDRETPPTLDIGRRTGIAEVEVGFDAMAARQQAARCLVCHVQTIYDPEKCVLCNRCVDVCPEYCLAIVPFESLDLDPATRAALAVRADAGTFPLSAMVKDDERCIRCGLCAIRCPTEAMTMEKFSITERYAPAPLGAAAHAQETP